MEENMMEELVSSLEQPADIMPKWMNANICNPIPMFDLNENQVKEIKYMNLGNKWKEEPLKENDVMIMSKVCRRLDNHFCGHIHYPEQHEEFFMLRTRPNCSSKYNFLWPCGLENVIIKKEGKDHIMKGSRFVRCKCGNSYPTKIDGNDVQVMTFCANDLLTVKNTCKDNKYACVICGRKSKQIATDIGFSTNIKMDFCFCLRCMPFKMICRKFYETNKYSFTTPSFQSLLRSYNNDRKMPNNAHSVLQRMNPDFDIVEYHLNYDNIVSEYYKFLKSVPNFKDLKVLDITRRKYRIEIYRDYGRYIMWKTM
uniref:NSP1 n=1 Tax=Rotavirus G TaxID=183407 RepID=A0A345ANN0_9REOV|nr:NSP1 [Rotavirus G]